MLGLVDSRGDRWPSEPPEDSGGKRFDLDELRPWLPFAEALVVLGLASGVGGLVGLGLVVVAFWLIMRGVRNVWPSGGGMRDYRQ